MTNNLKSKCCGAEAITVQGYPKDEGTHYWQCTKCGQPCDVKSMTNKPKEAKILPIGWEEKLSRLRTFNDNYSDLPSPSPGGGVGFSYFKVYKEGYVEILDFIRSLLQEFGLEVKKKK